jgi:hypothetical protein
LPSRFAIPISILLRRGGHASILAAAIGQLRLLEDAGEGKVMTDISPRDVPLDDDDWVPTEPELEYDNSDELIADHSPIAVEAQEDVPDRAAWSGLAGQPPPGKL